MPRSVPVATADDMGFTSNDTAAASGDVSGDTVFVMGASGLNSDSLASDDAVDAQDHDESIEVADEETL